MIFKLINRQEDSSSGKNFVQVGGRGGGEGAVGQYSRFQVTGMIEGFYGV